MKNLSKAVFLRRLPLLIIKLHQWSLSHPAQSRAFHAIWETALSAFLVGLTPVLHLIATHHYNDAKVALYGLIVAVGAAGLSTAKSQLWPIIVGWASSSDQHITKP